MPLAVPSTSSPVVPRIFGAALSFLTFSAAAAAVLVCVLHAIFAIDSGYYVSHVSGVWLGLAKDVSEGVLYRPLASETGYGGTRYAPLLFVSIGLLMRLGVPPLAAGFTIEVLAGLLLAAGVFAYLTRLGLMRGHAATLATLVLAPYFVHETLFEIRADVLAVTLQIWGLYFVLAGERAVNGHARRALAFAALLFTLAWATKITSVAVVAAATVSLALAGRRRLMLQLAAMTSFGGAAAALVTYVASDGRIVESFRAVALADTGIWRTLSSMLTQGPAVLVGGSFILKALLLPIAAAILFDRRIRRTPAALFVVCSALVTMFVMSSPGTVLRNQIVELWTAAVICLGVWIRARPRIALVASAAVACLLAVSARHVAVELARTDWRDTADRLRAERQSLVAAVGYFNEPALSESAVLPVLAGKRPYLLDPFALHVIVQSNPAVALDLDVRLDRRFFTHIVLEYDPMDARGIAAYTGMHFGRPVIERMLANYRFETSVGRYRIYVPRE